MSGALDWNLIRSFAAVAETGSLSAAARRLQISQPTLGRHVAELERDLGLTLFMRARTGYALTDRGAALFERAKTVGEHAEAFARLATGAAENVAGTVRISASEVVSAYVLPPMLARFAAEEPDIEIEIAATNQVDNLLRRDADIAVRMVRPTQLDLVARKVCDIPLVACAAASYLDRRGRPATALDLLDHDLLGFDRNDLLIRGFADMGVEVDRHAFRFRTDNQIVLFEALRAGLGVSFAQRMLVDRDPCLEAILPELALPPLPVWLAMHRDLRMSARIRRVADFLFDGLKRYSAG